MAVLDKLVGALKKWTIYVCAHMFKLTDSAL